MKFRDLHSNVKIRIGVGFAFGIAQTTTFPFMAIYFASNFGEATTGALLTLSAAISMISGILGGYFADEMGRKKLLAASELVFLLSYAVMALVNSPWLHSPAITFAAFLLGNACWGVYAPVEEAMLLDVTDAENRQLMYTIFYWMFNLTMSIGASIGAVLFESYRFELFAGTAVVVLGILLTTVFFIKESYVPAPRKEKVSSHFMGIVHGYGAVLRDKVFLIYVCAGILFTATESQLQNFAAIRLARDIRPQNWHVLNWFAFRVDGVKLVGFLQTENTIMVVLLAGLALMVAKRFSDRIPLLFGGALQVLGYAAIMVTSVPLALFIAMFFATVGEVVSVPVRQSYLGDLAPENGRGSYLAVNGMTLSIGRTLASFSVMLGAVLPVWGMGLLILGIGMIGLVCYHLVVQPAGLRREVERASAA